MHFEFDCGSPAGSNNVVTVTSDVSVDDDKWHHVTAGRTASLSASLIVDDIKKDASNTEGHSSGVNLNLRECHPLPPTLTSDVMLTAVLSSHVCGGPPVFRRWHLCAANAWRHDDEPLRGVHLAYQVSDNVLAHPLSLLKEVNSHSVSPIRYAMDFGALRHITSLDGHYEAIPQPMPFQQARQYCQMHDYDLASVHSAQEQQLATDQV